MTTARLIGAKRLSSNVYAMFTPKLPNALDITKATLSLKPLKDVSYHHDGACFVSFR